MKLKDPVDVRSFTRKQFNIINRIVSQVSRDDRKHLLSCNEDQTLDEDKPAEKSSDLLLCLGLWQKVFKKSNLFFPVGVDPRRSFIVPTASQFSSSGIKRKPDLKVLQALIPVALNVGLMKLRRGFTSGMGKKLVAKDERPIVFLSFFEP